jgi:inorganic pyrophosphatase
MQADRRARSRSIVERQEGARNDRVFVVPDRSPFEGDLHDILRLPARAIEELEKFFEATDALETRGYRHRRSLT